MRRPKSDSFLNFLIRSVYKPLNNKLTPRWYVLLVDLFSVVLSYCVALYIRHNLDYEQSINKLFGHFPEFLLSVSVYLAVFFIFKSYSSSVRFVGLKDLFRLFVASSFGIVIQLLISSVDLFFDLHFISVIESPFSILIIQYFVLLFLLIWSRIIFKRIFERLHYARLKERRVLIYGAGSLGQIAKNIYEGDTSKNVTVVSFVDDDERKSKKIISGVRVYTPNDALSKEFIDMYDVQEVVLAINTIARKRRREIVDNCLNLNLEVKQTPSVASWVNGELNVNQIKRVRIEDLLDRPQIVLEKDKLHKELDYKTVLVSGAAGSIGSEIVNQLTRYRPDKIIAVDQSETGLYDLERIILAKIENTNITFKAIIGDVSNIDKMNAVFNQEKPQVVYHAAAYKHVPLMENNPEEGVRVNVFGTQNMVDLAISNSVEKFVFVSTDKAVNPTNVMGATKRMAEIYVQSNDKSSKTKFITTRFGNVLGSNGSVIPLFREQIQKGGPITVTSEKITRYFMTIPEACQLVMEAGAMGEGGEIFVFDMGEPIKIIDLAKKMIRLSGLEIGVDIDIEIAGLRPGEKLYEELLNNAENTLPTHHPKILIGKTRDYQITEVNQGLDNLHSKNIPLDMVKVLKEIIPEFKSNNSEFEVLDK